MNIKIRTEIVKDILQNSNYDQVLEMKKGRLAQNLSKKIVENFSLKEYPSHERTQTKRFGLDVCVISEESVMKILNRLKRMPKKDYVKIVNILLDEV